MSVQSTNNQEKIIEISHYSGEFTHFCLSFHHFCFMNFASLCLLHTQMLCIFLLLALDPFYLILLQINQLYFDQYFPDVSFCIHLCTAFAFSLCFRFVSCQQHILGFFFFINLFFILFIFGCVSSSLLRVGFFQLWLAGAILCCGAWASHCGSFSCCGARALERRLSSCGTWTQQLWLTGSRAQAQQLWRTGLVAPWHVGSSWTRARTHVPCISRQILNHCTTREVPVLGFLKKSKLSIFFLKRLIQFTYICCNYLYIWTCFCDLNILFQSDPLFLYLLLTISLIGIYSPNESFIVPSYIFISTPQIYIMLLPTL